MTKCWDSVQPPNILTLIHSRNNDSEYSSDCMSCTCIVVAMQDKVSVEIKNIKIC